MSDQPQSGIEPHILTAEDLRALETFHFPVTKGPGGRPCVFVVRRLSVLSLMMEGFLQNPMLQEAMGIMDEIRGWVNDGRSIESIFQDLTEVKRVTLLEQLQQYACRAVLQPKLTLDPVQDPDAFPVVLIDADTLFKLWRYEPPEAVLPRLSEEAAKTFRPASEGGAPAAGSDGQGVRATTLDLGAQPTATRDA